MLFKIYTDGASQGNPGPSGAGVVIVTPDGQQQLKNSLGDMSNHEAEFRAAIWGFEQLATFASPDDLIMFFTDSRLLADAVGKGYAKHYQALVDTLTSLIDHYKLVMTEWVPDKANRGAHALALQSIRH
jgi:ribonuclease HI